LDRLREFLETAQDERRDLLYDGGWQNWPPTLVVVALAGLVIAGHWLPHIVV